MVEIEPFKDAHGREIKVGDRVRWMTPAGPLPATVTAWNEKELWLRMTNGYAFPLFRHQADNVQITD